MAEFKLDDVFMIEGRGVGITGQVLDDQILVNASVEIDGGTYQVSHIEAKNASLEYARKGAEVGLLLKGVMDKNLVKKYKGQTLSFTNP